MKLPMPFDKWLATRKRSPRAKIKRLPPISKRRAEELKEYRLLSKKFLQDHPYCAVWSFMLVQGTYEAFLGVRLSEEIHHAKGRTGKRLLDTKYWIAVSKWGHAYIHNNPKWAYENGFLQPR